MKGQYLVMDNAPIHKSENIAKYIRSRGYRCACLRSYSPELDSIEQFWSVVKRSKVRRNMFPEKGSLMTRIGEACDSLMLSDVQRFVSHSHNAG